MYPTAHIVVVIHDHIPHIRLIYKRSVVYKKNLNFQANKIVISDNYMLQPYLFITQ